MLPKRFTIPILADLELHPRGDGSYIMRPRIPLDENESWISVKTAARLISRNVKPRMIHRWIEKEYLVYRKPHCQLTEVTLASVLRLRKSCKDPEFWRAGNPVRKRLQSLVQKQMRILIADALQAV